MFWKVTGWPLWVFLLVSSIWILICAAASLPSFMVAVPFIIGFFFSTDQKTLTSFRGLIKPETWSARLAFIFFPFAVNLVFISDFIQGKSILISEKTSRSDMLFLIIIFGAFLFATIYYDLGKRQKVVSDRKLVLWVSCNFLVMLSIILLSFLRFFLGLR